MTTVLPTDICIAGGGTGGHVMPALALADAARLAWPNVQVSFIGAERGLEARLLPERGESVLLLTMHAVKGSGWLQAVRVLGWELPVAVLKIRKSWAGQKPKVLVGVGGYASVAGVVAALISRVPVVLYEQNAIPGLVNRQLHRFCHTMMLGFAAAKQQLNSMDKVAVTGNIVRQSIKDVQRRPQDKPTLLMMGGSQGAMFLNETMPKVCAKLAAAGHDFRVVHLVGAGEGRVEAVLSIYAKAGIEAEVMAFCEVMPSLYAKASLMIARAGAMTVCEAAAVGLPAMFVPLPSAADNHQYFNAKALADMGAAVILSQDESDETTLEKKVADVLFQPQKLADMARASRSAFIKNADVLQLQVLAPFLTEVHT